MKNVMCIDCQRNTDKCVDPDGPVEAFCQAKGEVLYKLLGLPRYSGARHLVGAHDCDAFEELKLDFSMPAGEPCWLCGHRHTVDEPEIYDMMLYEHPEHKGVKLCNICLRDVFKDVLTQHINWAGAMAKRLKKG